MIKGKSKIQLFDAKTGNIVSEQKNCNMVTEALETIASCNDQFGLLRWWRDTNASANSAKVTGVYTFSMLPLATRALGGLLLWDGNITEDPSVMFIPQGADEVGHAGSEYAGTDIYRGSYNTNESGEISGGYRHVWDFGTDKANGTIKCLSLTSQHGGNVGWHGNFETNKYPLFNHCYFSTDNTYAVPTYSANYISLSGSSAGRIFYMQKLSDGTLRLFKRYGTRVWTVIAADPSKITLTMSLPELSDEEELLTLDTSYSALYVYQGKIHEITNTSNASFTHKVFSLSGVQESSVTIDLSFTMGNYYQYCATVYRDGYYYCTHMTDYTIRKLDEQGEIVAELPVTDATSGGLYLLNPIIDEYSGDIIMLGCHGNVYCSSTFILKSNDRCAFVADSYSYPSVKEATTEPSINTLTQGQLVKTDDMRSPIVFHSCGEYGCRLIPIVNMAYMATVNNLQTPITKTSAQTMKITYEIYDE